MIRGVILDTGPLVAFMHAPDQYHDWARGILHDIEAPMITCDAVISEACFLLGNCPSAVAQIGGFLKCGVLEIPFSLAKDSEGVFPLMKRYANVPMSFADACLVSMSEQHKKSKVLTLDSDFEIYRRHRRNKIPLVTPWSVDSPAKS